MRHNPSCASDFPE